MHVIHIHLCYLFSLFSYFFGNCDIKLYCKLLIHVKFN